jgi:hypothetical protein
MHGGHLGGEDVFLGNSGLRKIMNPSIIELAAPLGTCKICGVTFWALGHELIITSEQGTGPHPFELRV